MNTEEFKERLNKINPTISLVGEFTGMYEYQDCICDKGHKFKSRGDNLIHNKRKCPVCNGKQVFIGYTDMWATAPEQARMLLDPEDGYKYTKCSGQKVWWKCPCCGEHLYKAISNVNKRGLKCNKCADGISFPNKITYNVLSQLGVDFIPEYRIQGSAKRYDFYIPSNDLIIEVQGKQHYDGWDDKRVSVEDITNNDVDKYIYAINSGIKNYIFVDARENNIDYISKSLIASLSPYYDLTLIDWDTCLMYSSKSVVLKCCELYNNGSSTSEIVNILKHEKGTIVNWLKIGSRLGLCNWVPSKGFLNDERKVVLINTGYIYNSISEAVRCLNYSGINVQNISRACQDKSYCGIDDKGHPLIWRYLDDYDPTIKYFAKRNWRSGHPVNQYSLDGIFISSYKSISDAMRKCNNINRIRDCCIGKIKSAGGYKWYYAEDENQPDKERIM